jgi:tetratricopeptide (TPR) repeat protein
MHKQNRRQHIRLAAVALAVIIAGGFSGSGLSALAAPKPIDWDKELVKERQLLETNNVEEAVKILDKYLKKHPEAAALHSDMGKALKKRGKLAEARAEFKRATEVDANYPDAWYELGAIYENDKEWQLAIDTFERYLSVAPYGDRKESVKDRVNFCKSKL